jgi:hypothetical protein
MIIHLTINDRNCVERICQENATTVALNMIAEGDGREFEELRQICHKELRDKLEDYFLSGGCLKMTFNMETGELKPVRLLR